MKTDKSNKLKMVFLSFLAICIIGAIILLVFFSNQKYKKYGTFGTVDHQMYLTIYYDNSYIIYDNHEEELYSGMMDTESTTTNNNVFLFYDDERWFLDSVEDLFQFNKISDKPIIVTIQEG